MRVKEMANVSIDRETSESAAPRLKRKEVLGKPVIIRRNGRVKVGVIVSHGRARTGVDVLDMKTNTSVTDELVPMTVYVSKELAEELTRMGEVTES